MEETDKDLSPLPRKEIKKQLKNLKGWEFKINKISKTFEFVNFTEAVKFVDGLVNFCNSIDHHPDIFISYKIIRFELTRFSVGGKVTDRDFTVAKKIEEDFAKKQKKF
jgi:4a-hydroxytetrahydrobiopterin dehydratase